MFHTRKFHAPRAGDEELWLSGPDHRAGSRWLDPLLWPPGPSPVQEGSR